MNVPQVQKGDKLADTVASLDSAQKRPLNPLLQSRAADIAHIHHIFQCKLLQFCFNRALFCGLSWKFLAV